MAVARLISSGCLRNCFQNAQSRYSINRVTLLFLLIAAMFLITVLFSKDSNYSIRHDNVPFSSTIRCLSMSNETIPHDEKLLEMSLSELRCLYERHITSLQSLCTDIRRYGNVQYGGVRLCMDKEFAPSHGCSIYSFNHDLSQRFIEQMERNFNCKVIFFGNNLIYSGFSNLGGLNNVFDTMKRIDVAILKINQFDFPFLIEFIGIAKRLEIKQIILEIHYDPKTGNEGDYRDLLRIFRKFYNSDYEIYWYDRNWICLQQMDSVCFTVNMYQNEQERPLISNKIDLPRIESFGSKTIGKEHADKYEDVFWDYVSKHQILCKSMIRVGNIEDGGWDICNDERFRPRSPCIVYSIGINYDFSFDDAIERIFRCDVFSFDPSMDIGDHNRSNHIKFYKLGIGDKNEEVIFRGKVWKLKTLKQIQEMLGHTNKRIDILKMDIENNEFQTLPDMIRSGAMKNVAQFCVEFHHYYDIQTIRELHNLGFRIYWSHQNPFAEVYKNDQSYSFGNDVHFVNINMVN